MFFLFTFTSLLIKLFEAQGMKDFTLANLLLSNTYTWSITQFLKLNYSDKQCYIFRSCITSCQIYTDAAQCHCYAKHVCGIRCWCNISWFTSIYNSRYTFFNLLLPQHGFYAIIHRLHYSVTMENSDIEHSSPPFHKNSLKCS